MDRCWLCVAATVITRLAYLFELRLVQRHVDFRVHEAQLTLEQVDQLHAQIDGRIVFELLDFSQLLRLNAFHFRDPKPSFLRLDSQLQLLDLLLLLRTLLLGRVGKQFRFHLQLVLATSAHELHSRVALSDN